MTGRTDLRARGTTVEAVAVLVGIGLLWIMIAKALAISLRGQDEVRPLERAPSVRTWRDIPANRAIGAFPATAGMHNIES
jgi:hypothetical protein